MSEKHFGRNDYQFGHCHYFAKYLIRVFKEMLPKVDVKYHLVLAARYDDDEEIIDDVLIHAYLKVGNYLIDSEGVHSFDTASDRAQSWADVEKDLTPDGYDFETWEEESENIPEMFFNRWCSTKQLKDDVLEFVKRPDVMEVVEQYK
jgi:hypothetical protein